MSYRILLAAGAASLLIMGAATASDFAGNKGGDEETQRVLRDASETPYEAQNEEEIDVEESLNSYMEDREWGSEYTAGKFRIFQIGTYSFPLEKPTRDRGFVQKRTIAATMAQLDAKVQIIKGIRTNMRASDQITMPGTDVYAELNEEKILLEDELADIAENLEASLEQANKAEYERLKGADWSDRTEAFADALIKKLNSSYDKSQIDDEKTKKAKALALALAELKQKEKTLRDKAMKLRGSSRTETSSSIAAMAQMPLYGIMILATEESWDPDTKIYEVGVLTVWSQKHEMRTRAMLTGEIGDAGLAGNDKELRRWLKRQNLANMIGGSNFTDSNGVRWIVGAAMSEIRGNNKKSAKGKAKLLSQKEVAMTLFSEIESHELYQSASKENTVDALANKTEMQMVESYAKAMRQSFKDRNVAGVFFIKSKTMKHPFTGKKIYVAVSATSTLSNQAAFKIEKINYKTNQKDIASQQHQKGVKDGYEKRRQAAKDDKSNYNAGIREGSRSIKGSGERRRRASNSSGGGSRDGARGGAQYTAGSRAKVKDDDF